MSSVPDRVFAELMVGPGVAVEPARLALLPVLAPCAGVVAALHPHAFVIDAGAGRAVLVHVGIDTVRLGGLGFVLHVPAGARVERGDRVLTFSPVDVAAAGLSTLCPVVALQADPAAVRTVATLDVPVAAGDELLDWD
jgi:glucose-specific phosphotransferase system IIA component